VVHGSFQLLWSRASGYNVSTHVNVAFAYGETGSLRDQNILLRSSTVCRCFAVSPANVAISKSPVRWRVHTGWLKKLHVSICLMLNWYSFVKSQPNFIIIGWDEDILNIACKLISTFLFDWHDLVVCQHNSWANCIFRQHRKRTILFLQGSVEMRNRCYRQYMHCFVGNQFRSAKKYKIWLKFHKAISI